MVDFDDISLARGPERPLQRPIRSGPPASLIGALVLLVLSVGALWYFIWRPKASAPEAVPAGEKTTVHPLRRAAEPGEAIDLPPLDQSDAVVRMLAGRLSSHPVAAAWLTTNDLIRNLTAVVAAIADGDSPAKHLRPLRPAGSFAAKTSGGSTWIDPATYHRYDAIAAAVDGLDARGVARFYATVKPRIDEAYHELTGSDADFDRTLVSAIVMLLKTPVVDANVRLQPSKPLYTFASPALEDLPKVQRQFLRMGPENVRIVKAKLRAVAGFLGIPETALPPPDPITTAPDGR